MTPTGDLVPSRFTHRSPNDVPFRSEPGVFQSYSGVKPTPKIRMSSFAPTRKSPLYLMNRGLRRFRRKLYDLRAFVPGLSFHHRCEKMIGPVGYWKELQQYQLNVLQKNDLKPEHSLLDLGSGPLQGGIAFVRYLNPGRYTAVDLRVENIDAAWKQIIRHDLAGKNPRLIRSANFGDEYLGETRFDFIFVSQLLYILDEPTIVALMAFIRRRLKPGGKFLGDIINPDQYASVAAHYPGFIPYSLESMQGWARAEGLAVKSLGEISHYHYPARITFRQNLMLEITRKVTSNSRPAIAVPETVRFGQNAA